MPLDQGELHSPQQFRAGLEIASNAPVKRSGFSGVFRKSGHQLGLAKLNCVQILFGIESVSLVLGDRRR